MTIFNADEVDDTIHARGRLNILVYLASVEFAEFMTIAEEINLNKGTVSQHLKKLEDAGLVKADRQLVANKTRTTVSLTRDGRLALNAWIDKMQTLIKAAETSPSTKRA